MGLTNQSVGKGAADDLFDIQKRHESDKIIALAGNPNVGKSTIFNALTGMNQHTGNWPGKTVANAQGYCEYKGQGFVLVDIPGCYSLLAHSAEEQVARDFLCFGGVDGAVVVCDATSLERNLNLVLQTLEITRNVVVCVNMMDDARRKNICIDLQKLEARLGVRVVGTSAREHQGTEELLQALLDTVQQTEPPAAAPSITYTPPLEEAIEQLSQTLDEEKYRVEKRWLSLRLLENSGELISSFENYRGIQIRDDYDLTQQLKTAEEQLQRQGITQQNMRDEIVGEIVHKAEETSRAVTDCCTLAHSRTDRRIDRFLTGRFTGFFTMFLLLAVLLWITISGANYPSELLSGFLFRLGDQMYGGLRVLQAPVWLCDLLINGVYRVTAWVVSVMLPPMAIFFPLFTLLEDLGYLPRIAFNLDKVFKKCGACGKQALTSCMGLGCNAAGIVGCRIIDSPRERLIAMLTNNFVPCNGRFPTLIAIISMFFIGFTGSMLGSLWSALLLTALIVLSLCVSFGISKLLSSTVLKGVPSSFTLELPPYRKPKILSVIWRSIFDRTLFVLGRAAAVAVPAGLLIWILSNVTAGDATLLQHITDFLDPVGRLMGLDGVILVAFILGLPANEIVVPIIIMAYMATGSIMEISDLGVLKQLLLDNGWTMVTALNTMLFSLMHWPCSTTLMTIKKESGGWKWAGVAFLIPTACGFLLCTAVHLISKLWN